MAIPSDVLVAFRRLIEQHGSEVEPYINIQRFWEDEDLLQERQRSLEKHIQQEYLPGFEFESQAHFKWHFNERDDPFLILRGRSPDRFFERWIRSIMVPSVLHYRAEIALAMKNWEQRYRWRLERQGVWDESWTWIDRVRQVLRLGPVVGCQPEDCNVTDRAIYRWAQDAPKHRSRRRNGNPPSAWYIECITLPDDNDNIECITLPDGRDVELGCEHYHLSSRIGRDNTDQYLETWRWDDELVWPEPGPDHPEPESFTISRIITFTTAADASLWWKEWKAKKAKRRSR